MSASSEGIIKLPHHYSDSKVMLFAELLIIRLISLKKNNYVGLDVLKVLQI